MKTTYNTNANRTDNVMNGVLVVCFMIGVCLANIESIGSLFKSPDTAAQVHQQA